MWRQNLQHRVPIVVGRSAKAFYALQRTGQWKALGATSCTDLGASTELRCSSGLRCIMSGEPEHSLSVGGGALLGQYGGDG